MAVIVIFACECFTREVEVEDEPVLIFHPDCVPKVNEGLSKSSTVSESGIPDWPQRDQMSGHVVADPNRNTVLGSSIHHEAARHIGPQRYVNHLGLLQDLSGYNLHYSVNVHNPILLYIKPENFCENLRAELETTFRCKVGV